MMFKQIIIGSLILFFGVVKMNAQVWKDPNASVDERVEDLLSKMTLEEKISYCGSSIPAIERLGILYFEWYGEALHGIIAWNCTQFPQNIAMGATWNPELMFDVATAISNEARALKNTVSIFFMYSELCFKCYKCPKLGLQPQSYSYQFRWKQCARQPIQMANRRSRWLGGNGSKYGHYRQTWATGQVGALLRVMKMEAQKSLKPFWVMLLLFQGVDGHN